MNNIDRMVTGLKSKLTVEELKDCWHTHANDWREVYELNDANYFNSIYWSYGDYQGSTIERSNYESLKKFLDEHKIEHWIVIASYDYHSIVIPMVAWQENNALDKLLQGLVNYPVIDEFHWCELEGQLEREFMTDHFLESYCKNYEHIPASDLIDAYYLMIDIIGYGMEFGTGCIPYFHNEQVEQIVEILQDKDYTIQKR